MTFTQLNVINEYSHIIFSNDSLFLRYSEKLTLFGEPVTSQALKLYGSSAPCPTSDRCPERLYTTMTSDMRVTCPNNDLAKRAAGSD